MKTKQEVIKALELCADPEGSCMSRAMRDAAELLKEATHES